MINIAVDAMGGDQGPLVVVPAALKALREQPDLHLILVGDSDLLHSLVSQKNPQGLPERLSIQHASQ